MSSEKTSHFNGIFIKENRIFYRQYQENIFNKCKNKNSLVVLPTGLGKTIIGILLISHALKKYSKSKILILAPTRPLVSQHKVSCENFLDIDLEKITSFTGKVTPEKRILSYKEAQIIISTPQIIKNDLERGRYDLKEVSLIIFDEAHRTRGNYSYCFISEEYINTCTDPLILGLTASPGKNYQRIQELCENLFIENVIFKTYTDNDVEKYIYDIDTFLEFVDLPVNILEFSAIWYNLFEKYLRFFIERKLIPPNKPYYSKLDFIGIAQDLNISLRYENGYLPDLTEENYFDLLYNKSPRVIDLVNEQELNIESIFSYCSSCVSILHGKELLETQNISLFNSFLHRLEAKYNEDILSAKRIVNSDHYKYIKTKLETKNLEEFSHPKIEKLITIINEEIEEYNNKKIIIFTQYREMAEYLKETLINHYKAELSFEKFIGQSTKVDDVGFTQNRQSEIIKDFRENKINILLATSVAEEGLDIPNVDAIVFYEPVPSEIRMIQRRGRTGRHGPGRCYLLITRETVDVPFYKVANRKESTMNAILSQPKQLNLCTMINRKKITFHSKPSKKVNEDSISAFYERRNKEIELLANRSIEEILEELDKFSTSIQFKNYKNHGITFVSDLINFDPKTLKKSILKIKGKKRDIMKEKKVYLNKNVKALINIVKCFNNEGKISFDEFQKYAHEEDIVENKFYIHFNRACNLGYLKKEKDNVIFLADYE